VGYFKFLLKVGFHMVLKFRVTTSEDKVINIKNEYYGMASYFLGIDIRVRMTSRKSSVNKKSIHFGIPSSRFFLKTINMFLRRETRLESLWT
jgi:hypothetical protein